SNHALPTLRLGDSRLTVLVSHLDENKTSCSDYFRNSLHFPLIDTSSAANFDYGRFQWPVLACNEPALVFYRSQCAAAE
ncbi:MAG: hypothetical protein NT062_16555, partial [Proteobacteria bacterium]|nr:hypothetical protein [Pseudomonadota bacterium]